MSLESRRLAGSQVKLSPPDSRSFCVDSISVSKSEMTKWDVSSMIRKDARSGASKLKCTNLTLEFPNTQGVVSFEKRLVFLKLQWGTALRQIRSIRNVMDAGKLAILPATSPSLPGAKIVSGKGARATIGEAQCVELSADMQAHELDSIPLQAVYEMSAENGRNRVGKTRGPDQPGPGALASLAPAAVDFGSPPPQRQADYNIRSRVDRQY